VADLVTGFAERYRALKHIIVVFMGAFRRVGRIDAEQGAQFSQKQRIVGAFGAAFIALPSGDECVGCGIGCCLAVIHAGTLWGFCFSAKSRQSLSRIRCA
jgi:hypothetical protein